MELVYLWVEKYKNTVFKKGQHLFGLYESKSGIIQKDFVYVVEGQFDVIKANEKVLEIGAGKGNFTKFLKEVHFLFYLNFLKLHQWLGFS
jgi:tRNA A58 N-methylase Trm61